MKTPIPDSPKQFSLDPARNILSKLLRSQSATFDVISQQQVAILAAMRMTVRAAQLLPALEDDDTFRQQFELAFNALESVGRTIAQLKADLQHDAAETR